MENYRNKLAEKLRDIPKNDRKAELESAKTSSEYWKAKLDKMGEKAEMVDESTGFKWEKKTVFHGSVIENATELEYAEESTIGHNAIYFALEPELAIGYAKLRKEQKLKIEKKDNNPFLYEVILKNISVQNWVQEESVEKLKIKLKNFIENIKTKFENMDFNEFVEEFGLAEYNPSVGVIERSLSKMIKIIDSEDKNKLNGRNTKNIAQSWMGWWFQKFVEDSGYDGVVTVEGGDDTEHTGTPGISFVLYNKEKIDRLNGNNLSK